MKTIGLSLLLLPLVCFLGTHAAEFAAAAIGTRLTLNSSVSYATFAEQFTTGLPPAQLYVFGEDVGLFAGFIGSRGKQARQKKGTVEAFLLLAEHYAPQIAHYLKAYPNLPAIRALELALTDVMWRAVNSTFSAIAREHNAYVIAGTIAPKSVIASTDPEDIRMFGDPDIQNQTEVYLPVGQDVFNVALLFDPTGAIVGRTNKVHLTEPEINLLQLVHGNISDMQTFNLGHGIGSTCVAICFDAFFADILEHFDAQGCKLFVQPSYNLGGMWAAPADDGVWQPQDWMAGPLGPLQPKYKAYQYSINAMAVGNLFGMPGDGQSSINRRSSSPPQQLFIGVEPNSTSLLGDVLAMAPWVAADPVSLPLSQRRTQLHSISLQLAPDSGSPLENAYRPSAIVANIGT
eukprot:TRINITY_DN30533_c0_g1_i1.p1 TRINITY_DN30533_c0_g1~~TRINITY_DN30533_c0_g1_i1.p1  ORF type:complete len:410 (-),score=66.27 TRINITY_DN30533_c0_g1_i1:11-1219(-)